MNSISVQSARAKATLGIGLLCCCALLALSACQVQSPRHTPEELASHKAWLKGSPQCQKLANLGKDGEAHNCWVDLPEDLTAAKPRYTAEQRASHEASLKAVAVCDQIQEMYKRARCFHDAPVDYTEEDPDEIEGVTLTGIDHLADYLSVQDFSVDGAVGGRAGQGGSIMCCANLPNRWREGLTVEVRWNVTNWRDCTGANYVRRVPVEPYHRPNPMYVHFLADGNVRVVVSFWYPEGANRSDSQYPIKDPIPDKAPWDKYPHDEACKKK